MLAGALLAASLALTPAQAQAIDAAVDRVMQADHIPGLSIGIARRGAQLFVRGYGVRDGDAAPDGHTTYRIGSLTKQFTAALVLQQVERGTLQLGTVWHGATVQQLLSQTSGIPDLTEGAATVETALASKPLFEPGTGWEYSNANYLLLGSLLEGVTKTPFATLLDTSILKPLELRDTSLVPSDANAAAAGMTSSVGDLLTWLDALQEGRVIAPGDFRAMVTSQSLASGARTHYGYGWYVRDWYGWKTAEHPGYVDGYSADDAIVLDDGLEIAVLARATDAFLLPITKTVVSLLEPPRDISLVADFSHPAQNENHAVTRDVTALVGELQAGTLDRTRLSPALNKTLDARQISQGQQLFAPLGKLTLVEFIDRTTADGVSFEKYRLSFGYKQFWMTLSYTKSGKVDTLSIEPDED